MSGPKTGITYKIWNVRSELALYLLDDTRFVVGFPKDGAGDQGWTAIDDDGLTLLSTKTGAFLEVDGSLEPGSSLVADTGNTQVWDAQEVSSGVYTLSPQGTDLVIGVPEGSGTPEPLILEENVGGETQFWVFEEL